MIKFLIIDDDSSLRRLYRHLLTRRYKNAAVDEAENGEEALIMVTEADYCAILTDVIMPIMDGRAFYNKLKDIRPAMAQRVCFTSAASHDDHSVGFIEDRPHLAKPFLIKDFYNLMDSFLAQEGSGLAGVKLKKRAKRVKIKEWCFLEHLVSRGDLSETLRAQVTNYSSGGLGLKYSGRQLVSGTNVEISVEALHIFYKKARIVWSKHLGGHNLSGVQWI